MRDDLVRHRPSSARNLLRRVAARTVRYAIRVRRDHLLASGQPTRYVFVVASGRSGSTLLEGLLNALPRTLVRGENGFFLLRMFRAYNDLRRHKVKYSRTSAATTSAFYGVREFDLGEFVQITRRYVIGQLIGRADPRLIDTIGFKEVYWHHITRGETEDFFDFFEAVFPGARYVLNWRDPEMTMRSGHWLRYDSTTARQALERANEVQTYLRESRPDRTYRADFEVLTAEDQATSDSVLRGLAEFVIGRCDDALLDTMRAVLRVPHGPAPFGRSRADIRTTGE